MSWFNIFRKNKPDPLPRLADFEYSQETINRSEGSSGKRYSILPYPGFNIRSTREGLVFNLIGPEVEEFIKSQRKLAESAVDRAWEINR